VGGVSLIHEKDLERQSLQLFYNIFQNYFISYIHIPWHNLNKTRDDSCIFRDETTTDVTYVTCFSMSGLFHGSMMRKHVPEALSGVEICYNFIFEVHWHLICLANHGQIPSCHFYIVHVSYLLQKLSYNECLFIVYISSLSVKMWETCLSVPKQKKAS